MVWRKIDNFTAFTDGYRSWIYGPYGLQQRLNTERFAWEAGSVAIDARQIVLGIGDLGAGWTRELRGDHTQSRDFAGSSFEWTGPGRDSPDGIYFLASIVTVHNNPSEARAFLAGTALDQGFRPIASPVVGDVFRSAVKDFDTRRSAISVDAAYKNVSLYAVVHGATGRITSAHAANLIRLMIRKIA